MTDPFSIFPQHPDGGLDHGTFHWIADEKLPEAVETGWRPVPPTDKWSHPVTDGRGTFCRWEGEGPMQLPEEIR